MPKQSTKIEKKKNIIFESYVPIKYCVLIVMIYYKASNRQNKFE